MIINVLYDASSELKIKFKIGHEVRHFQFSDANLVLDALQMIQDVGKRKRKKMTFGPYHVAAMRDFADRISAMIDQHSGRTIDNFTAYPKKGVEQTNAKPAI